jgi:hypothetical protein
MTELIALRQEVALWLESKTGQWLRPASSPRLRRSKRSLRLYLPGLNPVLSVILTPRELCVSAYAHGRTLDLLMCLDMEPVQIEGGWGCTLCESSPADACQVMKPFASEAALRQDHLLEPFFRWCNEKLAKATHLELYAERGGISYAQLKNVPPDLARPEWQPLWTQKMPRRTSRGTRIPR